MNEERSDVLNNTLSDDTCFAPHCRRPAPHEPVVYLSLNSNTPMLATTVVVTGALNELWRSWKRGGTMRGAQTPQGMGCLSSTEREI